MSRENLKRILVTGGAGFIGSAFVRYILSQEEQVKTLVNLDLLTYAGRLENLKDVENDPRHHFVRGDILDSALVEELVRTHQIEAIIHFAAESHVDNSIADPRAFYKTNVEGTIALLDVVRRFPHIHFHHVSTDEVYGSIEEGAFTEESPYRPNSPYAASKASSDHFVRAYANTYGISVTLSHCSNNYGPYQFEEKFIPRMLQCCMRKNSLPVYGKGTNVRDWLFVDDHVEAIWEIVKRGKSGHNYNIGGREELRNIDLLHILIERYAERQKESATQYASLISYVKDRPGHDFRYALHCEKIEKDLGWTPKYPFEEGIDKTIDWYIGAWS